ncbi:MAG TPA: hypothetical protein DIW43_17490 [Spongiibacteraceae bacterium]|nr:hypothetical protein [Spongiibacteraceae bacterium]HCS29255.1 hypothetical protein [Spongiibacteraceae bacterium]|tara:strand:+ start:613 stop:999 length:387 start_codon:yes stop_codon:yes gene_type:complete
MMWLRIFLFVLAVVWTPYGFFCLFFPEALSNFAGLQATSVTATTELRAMYGGLQISIGLSALLGFFRVVYIDKVLFTQLVVVAGLAVSRLIAALIAGDGSGYTIGALVFEWSTVVFCVLAMRSQTSNL